MLTYGHPDPFKAGPLLSLEQRKYYPGARWAPPWRGLGRLEIHQLQMEVHASLAQYVHEAVYGHICAPVRKHEGRQRTTYACHFLGAPHLTF